MSKFILYLSFDGRILQWQDDEEYSYPPEPAEGTVRLQITDQQYADRVDPSWFIGGEITQTAPPPPDIPPPSSEDMLFIQSKKLQVATQLAAAQKNALSNRIGTIQDAIEIDEATPAEVVELPIRQAQLTEWKRYAIYLGRVTTQAGWHMEVDWPVEPAQGMDLSVSLVSLKSS